MNWAVAKVAIGILACITVQGCASFEQSAEDGAETIANGEGGEIPRLPVYQPVVATVEAPPTKKTPPKPVRRARAKTPATELARLPDAPPADEIPAAGPSFASIPVPAPEPVAPKLVGLNEEQLEATLGTPNERQDLMPGKVWRYQLPGCTVSVSLYPEVQTMVFRSLSYEVTSNDDTPDGIRACLSRRQSAVVK